MYDRAVCMLVWTYLLRRVESYHLACNVGRLARYVSRQRDWTAWYVVVIVLVMIVFTIFTGSCTCASAASKIL
jgi:hypothetical protein